MFANFLKNLVNHNVTNNHYNDKNAELVLCAQQNNSITCAKNDIVLVDIGLLEKPVSPGIIVEAHVNQTTYTNANITYKCDETNKNITKWIPYWAITSNLGDHWSDVKLKLNGIEIPPKPPKLPLITGSFILECDCEDYNLVEIDKVNGVYFIRSVDESMAEIIEPDHNHILHTFSKPEDGKYILDPGMYIDSDLHVVEVIPFKGKCWYRFINESEISELNNKYALKLNRIETDDDGLDYYLIGTEPGCFEPDCERGDGEDTPANQEPFEPTKNADEIANELIKNPSILTNLQHRLENEKSEEF